MKPEDILNLEMGQNDAEAPTIREYLRQLLCCLWNKGESFSGKRPFGNSGWEYDLYAALVKGKAVEGALDEDGYLETVDERAASDLIIEAINKMARA